MEIACLDLEGVLIPEIWIDFAERTGIEALKATTRDIPDYDVLMQQRLRLLDENGLGLPDIQAVIADMRPMEGAREFLDWLRARFQVVILSDTFYEFAAPLMAQLGWPTLLCHKLETDNVGKVVDYKIRQVNPKRQSVLALKTLYSVWWRASGALWTPPTRTGNSLIEAASTARPFSITPRSSSASRRRQGMRWRLLAATTHLWSSKLRRSRHSTMQKTTIRTTPARIHCATSSTPSIRGAISS